MAAQAEIAICGAGIAGIATAYALSHQGGDILLIDARPPMSLTTAASGENYRNWWPHPTLVAFMDRSLDLLEDLHRETGGAFRLSRRGYAYATRDKDTAGFVERLRGLYGAVDAGPIRVFEKGDPDPAISGATNGADVILDQAAIRARYPHISEEITALALVRRAGDFDTQQAGQLMLSRAKAGGARELRGEILNLQEIPGGFRLTVDTASGRVTLEAEKLVNAAGPFAGSLARLLGIELPLQCLYQQKVAFQDKAGILPRHAPFTIDLDAMRLGWSAEERELLAADPATQWLTGTLPGGLHIRPEGGAAGTWVKLGWAYNDSPADPQWDPAGDDGFPEILLRRAQRLVPGLQEYGETVPRPFTHYGGYYTRTADNWPLIGPMGPAGAFMVCGLAGYGTMAAAAAGELCTAWVLGRDLPGYAADLSLARYGDPALMAEIAALDSDGAL